MRPEDRTPVLGSGHDAPAVLPSRRGRPGPNRSEHDATAASSMAPAWSTVAAAIAGSSAGLVIVPTATMNEPNPVNGSKTAGGGHGFAGPARASAPTAASSGPPLWSVVTRLCETCLCLAGGRERRCGVA